MQNLLRAGLLALAILFAPSMVFASPPGCRPLEAMLEEIAPLADAGVRVVLLRGDEIAPAMVAITASHGPAPRPIVPSLIILLIGEQTALVFFAEATDVCLKLPMSRAGAEALERAVKGIPA